MKSTVECIFEMPRSLFQEVKKQLMPKRIMSLIQYPAMLFIVAFSFFGCATNGGNRGQTAAVHPTDLSHINPLPMEFRFYEETGGFSLVIPRAWEIIDSPLSNFKIIRGQNEHGFTPYIVFSIDTFDGPLDLMIDSLIQDWSIMHGEGFMVMQRGDFITSNNLKGERLVIISPMYGQQVRQVLYIFPGKNDTSIIAICAIRAEVGDLFDERFDRIMKTFEWAQPVNMLLREANRLFEEAGGFSIIVPDSWEAIELPVSEFRVLRGWDENGFLSVLSFSILPLDRQLDALLDIAVNELDNRYGNNFLLVYRGGFSTSENLKGEKFIAHVTRGDEHNRIIMYFLPGENNKLVIAVYSTELQVGVAFNEKINRVMETFRWTSN